LAAEGGLAEVKPIAELFWRKWRQNHMRIAYGGVVHETNAFSPIKTPLGAWEIALGDDIWTDTDGSKTNAGGFLEIARREGWEILPTIMASAGPSAPTDGETFGWIKASLIAQLKRQPVDAMFLSMHGAMLVEGLDDPEGELLGAIKQTIGDKPVVVTLDLHANNTEYKAAMSDAVFGYDTNPHVDIYERAVEAAECLADILNKKVDAVTAYAHSGIMPPTITMLTGTGAMEKLFKRAKRWESVPNMINVSVFGGFPFCDVPHAGLNVIATANKDRGLAQAACADICALARSIKEDFLAELPDVETAVVQARTLLAQDPPLPVLLADVADNPGGGGSGDTTTLLRALIEANVPRTAAALLWDAQTVETAIRTGVGNSADFSVGGKAHSGYGPPIRAHATVKAIADGKIRLTGPLGRGATWDVGPCARIEAGNVQILLSSRRFPCLEADIFRHLGIEPAQQRLIMVKSRGHFRASFEPLCSAIIEVDAPGAANQNLSLYPYKRVKAQPISK